MCQKMDSNKPSSCCSSSITTTSSSSSSALHSIESSNRIRSRYLERLGVVGNTKGRTTKAAVPLTLTASSRKMMMHSKNNTCSLSTDSSLRSRSPRATNTGDSHFQELQKVPSNMDSQQVPCSSPISSSSDSSICSFSSTTSTASSVRFEPVVQVHEIPNRRQLDRLALWMSPKEMKDMISRNYMEYRYDGWNYQHVKEESDFVYWGTKLVHPAHIYYAQNCHQQFFKILQAQQQNKQTQQARVHVQQQQQTQHAMMTHRRASLI